MTWHAYIATCSSATSWGGLGLAAWLLSSAAQAASEPCTLPLDVQQHRLPIDSERLLWADESAGAHPGYTMARLGAGYMASPVTFLPEGAAPRQPLAFGVESNAIVARWIGPVRLGLDVPMWVAGRHDCVEELLRGLGDISLDAKATIWERDEHPVGLAVTSRVQLPTGQVLVIPVTQDDLAIETAVVVDRDLGPLRLAVNLGTVSKTRELFQGHSFDDGYVYRAGAGWAVVASERLGLSADLAGHDPYGDQGGLGHSLEWLLGMWANPHPDWRLQLGAGQGLTSAVTASELRGVFALTWAPPRSTDVDGDGIPNRLDACRDVPEDIDQYSDSDGCPDAAAVASVVATGPDQTAIADLSCAFQLGDEVVLVTGTSSGELHPGTWSLTCTAPDFEPQTVPVEVTEGDTSPMVVVALEPAIATVQLRVTDLKGRQLDATVEFVDGETLAVADGRADVVLGKGSHTFLVTAPGHFPVPVAVDLSAGELDDILVQLDTTLAERTAQGVRLLSPLSWEGATARLQPASVTVLDDVSALLLAGLVPRGLQVAVATNDRGDARQNQELGAARAATIVAVLTARGVDPRQLQAVGLAPGADAVVLSWVEQR